MADINGVRFSAGSHPTVYHTVTYTKSRPNNSKMTYNFTIKTTLQYSNSWIGTGSGYGLNAYITVNGVTGSATMKSESTQWHGVNTYTTYISVTCPSSSGNTTQSVTFTVRSTGSLSSGAMSNSSYTVTSSALYPTDVGAPTSLTATPNPFDGTVTIKWSGATNGTNNSISGYKLEYIISADGSNWGHWKEIDYNLSKNTTTYSWTKATDLVPRGYYVRFAVQTKGSAGNSYYSYWNIMSSGIQRLAYTQCVAPTSFTISSDNFDKQIDLKWSGANKGTNNNIVGYEIECKASKDNSNWSDWCALKSVSLTSAYGSIEGLDVSSKVSRGYYVQLRIRTKGSAGSSYYSTWENSNIIKRDFYSSCTAPTSAQVTSQDITGNTHTDIFESVVTIEWNGASAGDNNNISGYYLQVRLKNDETGEWEKVYYTLDGENDPATDKATQVDTKLGQGSITANLDWIPRGRTATIIIATLGSAGEKYRSAYTSYDISLKRNSIPNGISSITVANLPSLEYSNGNNIELTWDKPQDLDNNIHHYEIQVAVGKKTEVLDDYYGITMLGNPKKVNWKSLMLDASEDENAITYTDPLTSIKHIVLSSNATSHIIKPTNSYYQKVENSSSANPSSLIQFRIKTVDIFGVHDDNCGLNGFVFSPIITRYDITGITIGIDGKWVNCQLYVGKNGQWVEQSVSAGVNGSWKDADIGI